MVRHKTWNTTAIAATLGSAHFRGTALDWTPSDVYELLLLASGESDEPRNKSAAALGGIQAHPFRGTCLLLAIYEQKVVSLNPQDLLIIVTRLIVAEVVAGELPGPPS